MWLNNTVKTHARACIEEALLTPRLVYYVEPAHMLVHASLMTWCLVHYVEPAPKVIKDMLFTFGSQGREGGSTFIYFVLFGLLTCLYRKNARPHHPRGTTCFVIPVLIWLPLCYANGYIDSDQVHLVILPPFAFEKESFITKLDIDIWSISIYRLTIHTYEATYIPYTLIGKVYI